MCSVCGKKYTQNRKPKEISRCSSCQKIDNGKLYYERNKEKIKVYNSTESRKLKKKISNRKYVRSHLEQLSVKAKEYYAKNREHLLSRSEAYRRSRGELPNGMSGTEEIASNILQNFFPNILMLSKDRATIKNPITGMFLELDFYFPQLKLAIELNGPTHYLPIYGKEKFERQKRNDRIKRECCRDLGIHLIEISLMSGVHYDRCNPEHDRFRRVLETELMRFREDKAPSQCTFSAHIGG